MISLLTAMQQENLVSVLYIESEDMTTVSRYTVLNHILVKLKFCKRTII